MRIGVRSSEIGVRSEGAFTLVELLAAMFFLAILIPAVTGGMSLGARAGEVAERGANAAQLAENKLNELLTTETWKNADRTGDFGDEWRGYRWQLTEGRWAADAMTELTLEVFYPVRGKEQSLRLVALVDSTEGL